MFQGLPKRLFGAKALKEDLEPKSTEHVNKIRLFHGEVLQHTDCDALVSFMTTDLSFGGPLNKAYLDMAGEELGDFIAEKLFQPKAGQAFVVPPFNMPVKNIILLVLPKWEDGLQNEDRHMLRCYRQAISQAQDEGIKSIAFPALGFKRTNFPHIRFARLAIRGILENLDDRMDEVRIVCRERTMADIYVKHLRKIGWTNDEA